MGDQIGETLETTMIYAPFRSVSALLAAVREPLERTALFADLCRLNALYMIARAGSGHIGSSFSSLDLVSWLLLHEMRPNDLYFSSKGHDAPGLYAALIGLGRLPEERLHRLRRLGGLPGHPDVGTSGIATNTGSLGMGISKAKGMILGARLRGERRRVFVLTGDGELQEGQIWESLASAVQHGLGELVAIVDHNKLQSDRAVAVTSDLGAIETKLASFGWETARVDGHDLAQIAATLERLRASARPKIVIADTIKGRGVSFMESSALPDARSFYKFHSGAPDAASYRAAVEELRERIMGRASRLRVEAALEFVAVARETPSAPAKSVALPERLIPAYSRALLAHARRDPRVVVLDADLMVDMGLGPIYEELPQRFFECGIAEMDMVSQAGGLALRGLVPICHSFACFLTARANEQIYNNATERTKVIYVGGLAGLLPAAPGHSHQSLRDIAALGAVPGLTLIQPSDEHEVAAALDYCIERAEGSCYLRLCSLPWPLPFAREPNGFEPGRGRVVRAGTDATLIAYGPVMLAQAHAAALLLEQQHEISVQVVALPWLNRIDDEWLRTTIGNRPFLFTLDDHHARGGQGEMILTRALELGLRVQGRRFFVSGIPACGAPDEVLKHHALDPESLCAAMMAVASAPLKTRALRENSR